VQREEMIVKISELSRRDKKHYEGKIRTAELIKLCYKYQFKDRKPNPEKIHALCKLAWCSDNKQYTLGALWIIWGKRGQIPYLTDLNELSSYGFPPQVARQANKPTGFVNFYKAYRNSSLVWIRRHYKQVSFIIHKAARLKSDDEARELADAIDNLPRIPKAHRQPGKISPNSFLTPLVACLDPRLRFPVVNKEGGVLELHKKLGIATFSLLDQFNTLIRLIGQYGIRNSLMLDTISYKLAYMKLPAVTIETKPPAKPGKLLGRKDDEDIVIISNGYTGKARRIHNSMTNKLIVICKKFGLYTEEGEYRENRFDALILNYNNKGKDLLIEAKGATSRSDLRLALGQLYDYRRKRSRRAATDLAVLLPEKPKSDDIDFLGDAGINVIWFTNSKLQKLAGNIEARFITYK
jgi:hypothetical protein